MRTAAAYFERPSKRPSYARALKESEPYLKMFPGQATLAYRAIYARHRAAVKFLCAAVGA